MKSLHITEKSVQIENNNSEEWLDFILNCRSGKDSTDYDFVVGGVANDKVFNTVELFFDGLIDKTEAINRLRYEKPNQQMCFGKAVKSDFRSVFRRCLRCCR